MMMRQLFLAVTFLCVVLSLPVAGLKLERTATFGEPHKAEDVQQPGKDSIHAIWWLSDDLLLVYGGADEASYLKCLKADKGEVVWEKRIERQVDGVTVSGDLKAVVLHYLEPVPAEQDDKRGVKEEGGEQGLIAAHLLDTAAGEAAGSVMLDEVYEWTRRDAKYSGIDQIVAGPKHDQVLVVLDASNSDEIRLKQDDQEGDGGDTKYSFGYRGYLLDLQRGRQSHRYKLEPYASSVGVAVGGRYVGYVRPQLFCVYDVKRRRDHLIFGKHSDRPVGTGFEIDVPFFSHIRVGEAATVVTKDGSNGPASSQLIVVDMKKGKILANRELLGAHVEVAVDFKRQRVAVTGSWKGLAVYGFDGTQLARLDNASEARNTAVAVSPGGDRIATGGYMNVVEIYSLAE